MTLFHVLVVGASLAAILVRVITRLASSESDRSRNPFLHLSSTTIKGIGTDLLATVNTSDVRVGAVSDAASRALARKLFSGFKECGVHLASEEIIPTQILDGGLEGIEVRCPEDATSVASADAVVQIFQRVGIHAQRWQDCHAQPGLMIIVGLPYHIETKSPRLLNRLADGVIVFSVLILLCDKIASWSGSEAINHHLATRTATIAVAPNALWKGVDIQVTAPAGDVEASDLAHAIVVSLEKCGFPPHQLVGIGVTTSRATLVVYHPASENRELANTICVQLNQQGIRSIVQHTAEIPKNVLLVDVAPKER